MLKLKQGTVAVTLIASLGLVMPASFGGTASADVSAKQGIQPMTIACDLDGKSNNGYEFESKVIAKDQEFTNNNTEGGERFKFSTLQDLNSTLVFTPHSGGAATTIYTAIENQDLWPDDDDSDRTAVVQLEADEARLDAGAVDYPVSFEIPPSHPFSYFHGGFSLGKSGQKLKLVNCDVTDIGQANPGETCVANGATLVQGELLGPALCFDNVFNVDPGDAENTVTDCLVGGVEQDLCFVPAVPDDPDTAEDESAIVSYHYTDIFHIKAQVSNNGGAKARAATAGDDAPSADRDFKAKHGKHKGKGRRGR